MYTVSLKAARINADLTQKEVANLMGVNVSTLVNWESGKTSPGIDQFSKLCKLYECPIDAIFLPKRFTLSESQDCER